MFIEFYSYNVQKMHDTNLSWNPLLIANMIQCKLSQSNNMESHDSAPKLDKTPKLAKNVDKACLRRAMGKPCPHFQQVLKFHQVRVKNCEFVTPLIRIIQ